MSRSRTNPPVRQLLATATPIIELDKYAMRVSAEEQEGHACGELLAQRAARILLSAYNDRPVTPSPASQAWAAAQERLESVLGVMVDDPRVSQALKDLDDTHGNALVESEEGAWHTAWTLAMSLKGR